MEESKDDEEVKVSRSMNFSSMKPRPNNEHIEEDQPDDAEEQKNENPNDSVIEMSNTREISASQVVGQQYVNFKVPKTSSYLSIVSGKTNNKIVHFDNRLSNNATVDPKNYISQIDYN